ncbi:Metallo-hydrolase/oxidoreductase [Coccomyxa subellipsoidea C-169]|uniref:Metallo-hydrolase/oxidoreductase n=1 Tax=Coccomyxa subellipsoidea (strain C-169) TaxID=574566 RepID=I0Z4E6_COCSC|nr:Metallo-hydrolase/oxidoreductase [Coccomyxa subellipsoidea C-169]EIE25515.1 Metallo-hydrolase/oxidoreductase [Coccomyxa subellipsoidea C-169]|eukprot:XP_005650059.1 Metallo-hydrolase/oxidoreductase [Coccomyxa subellipsoidea C-169]
MVKRGADTLVAKIIPLGAGQEVGRSCVILKYMGKTVMFDCGVHPGFSGEQSLPYFDSIDLDSVDLMLVTHFHLDHCAAVPYVVGKTVFKGRIFMTHPTKAIFGMLLKDSVKVSRGATDAGLYSEKDVEAALERTELLDFHQTIDVDGIKVTAWRAGHVLGAAMFMVEIAGMRALYTGDYSRLADRHMSAADLPSPPPHIVIVEATYGVSRHLPREGREQRFVNMIRAVVQRGGRCLLPVVALGRAQELMLILEDYWDRNADLRGVPIYQASGLARRALGIFQTYIAMMNDDIKAAFGQSANPFNFKYITELKTQGGLDDVGPCVVLATPSMLQSGLSRELFDAWCEDKRNGVIIADFAVQGTLARDILASPSHVLTKAGAKVPLRMSVEHISFSAHADFDQTSQFVELLDPPHVILVHGEAVEMGRLRKALEQQAVALGQRRLLYTPKVCQPVHIRHRPQLKAKVVGSLADKNAQPGKPLAGLLVQQGQNCMLMAPQDLPTFTKLHPGRIIQRQVLHLNQPWPELRLALEVLIDGVQGAGDLGSVSSGDASGESLRVANTVTLTHRPPDSVVMEWQGDPVGDAIADTVIAVILQSGSEPPAVSSAEVKRRKCLHMGDLEGAAAAEVALLVAVLDAQFGKAHIDADQGLITIQVDDRHVAVECKTGKVECADFALKARVEVAISRLMEALAPASLQE